MATNIEKVENGAFVTGVTFDPPLHWAEWDSREEAIVTAANNGEAESPDVMRLRDGLIQAEDVEAALGEIEDILEGIEDAVSAKTLKRLKAFARDAKNDIRGVMQVLEDAT